MVGRFGPRTAAIFLKPAGVAGPLTTGLCMIHHQPPWVKLNDGCRHFEFSSLPRRQMLANIVQPLIAASPYVALAVALLCSAGPAFAKETGLVFVSNEKSSTITILGADHQIVETFASCARPRGMHF